MTRMPFGRHAGVELADVPRPYLRWLRRQPWLGAWLVREIDDELNDKAAASDDGESFEEALEKLKQEWANKKGAGSE
jgi:predicted Rdx family selenoprotein